MGGTEIERYSTVFVGGGAIFVRKNISIWLQQIFAHEKYITDLEYTFTSNDNKSTGVYIWSGFPKNSEAFPRIVVRAQLNMTQQSGLGGVIDPVTESNPNVRLGFIQFYSVAIEIVDVTTPDTVELLQEYIHVLCAGQPFMDALTNVSGIRIILGDGIRSTPIEISDLKGSSGDKQVSCRVEFGVEVETGVDITPEVGIIEKFLVEAEGTLPDLQHPDSNVPDLNSEDVDKDSVVISS